jgi:hypothetical protein
MNTEYYSCACGWYGSEHDLLRETKYDSCEFWGQPVQRPYVEVVCPECHKDDSLSDAAPPCIDCEERPMEPGYDHCAVCLPKHMEA